MEVSGTCGPPRGSAERCGNFRAGRDPILPSARHPSTLFYLPRAGPNRSAGAIGAASGRVLVPEKLVVEGFWVAIHGNSCPRLICPPFTAGAVGGCCRGRTPLSIQILPLQLR